MKHILLSTDHVSIPTDILAKTEQALIPAIEHIYNEHKKEYATDYAFLHAPYDIALHTQVKKVIAIKKTLEPKLLIVIGIGGSNLGTIAVVQSIYGCFYNEKMCDMRVFFADTLDTDYMQDILFIAEKVLQRGEIVILNVITKSGTTTETIAHWYVFMELLRSFYPYDYHKYIVVTTDKGSPLYICAQQHALTILEIPQHIGGRYSVFSAVGLFPLGMIGIDTDALLKGARYMIELCLQKNADNIAAQTAAIRYYWYMHKRTINDLFLFSADLEYVGKWYRQLMGESIGKEHTVHGEKKAIGITPTVSIGTTDLHSVAQLYLAGPHDKLTVFVDIAKAKSHCYVPTNTLCDSLIPQIRGKAVSFITHALLSGVHIAYQKAERPFMQLVIPEKKAVYIGQLLQYMMIEMVYLGTLLELNPFDQPHVELYKQETRKILSNE